VQRRVIFGCFAGMVVLLAMFACNAASASQFTADITIKQGSDTTSGKIYVKDMRYRMDMVEDGHQTFVIVDQIDSVTRVLLPEGKMYIEMGTQDFRSLMNDPFQGVKYTASLGESKHVGTDTVNGYECDKYLIIINDQNTTTQWVSKKLEFPVRIVMDVSETNSVELQNIQENPVGDTLFVIPADYTMMKTDEPAKQPPVQTPEVTKEAPPEAAKEIPADTTEAPKETPR
jgi:outer membrane lipoprotein-sorting protein